MNAEIGESGGNPDPWVLLRRLSRARIGLGRRGTSLPTPSLLKLRADQIAAVESVHAAFDVGRVTSDLGALGIQTLTVRTLAEDREDFLKHPDHGRTLAAASRRSLQDHVADPPWDVVFLLSDGLSTRATEGHGVTVIRHTLEALRTVRPNTRIAPVVVVPFARVALLNDAGAAMGARTAAILLGERPGLSAADSLSAYLQYGPARGMTDADRNCISNIRPSGLDPETAGVHLALLIAASLERGISGTRLKIEYPSSAALLGE